MELPKEVIEKWPTDVNTLKNEHKGVGIQSIRALARVNEYRQEGALFGASLMQQQWISVGEIEQSIRNKNSLITIVQENIFNGIIKDISSLDKTDGMGLDEDSIQKLELLHFIQHNLKYGAAYFKRISEADQEKSWYNAECDKCGWFGSSQFLLGGGQIADTGDYGDVYCPICGNNNI